MKNTSLLFGAIATLTGTAIGAGFLGIPYVVSKSGFFIGLIQMIIIAVLVMLVNLYIGETILRTKETHQLPGYASIYLGKWARVLMVFSMVFGIYSAFVAYLLGEGQVLSFIFTNSLDYMLYFSVMFFLVIAMLLYGNLSLLKKGETFGLIAILTLITILTIFFIPKIEVNNLMYISNNYLNWLLPYGVILFSFLSFSAIPEVKQEIKGHEKLLSKSIKFGTIIPLVIYIIFTTIIVGFSGQKTPEIATIALGKIPSLLAVFTMFTASFALGSALRDMYILDLKINHFNAWCLSCFFPFVLFLIIYKFKLATFILLLELCGIVVGGVTGILAIFMVLKAKIKGNRIPEYSLPINWFIIFVLIVIFLMGILYLFFIL